MESPRELGTYGCEADLSAVYAHAYLGRGSWIQRVGRGQSVARYFNTHQNTYPIVWHREILNAGQPKQLVK